MPRTLIIGYGNSLRRDDGAGPEVARRVRQLHVPGIDVIEAHQLLPEHAERLSHYERVIFVDASVEEELQHVSLQRIEANPRANIDAHVSDPAGLLALASQLFGARACAWIAHLPVEDLGIGDGFSVLAEASIHESVRQISELIARPSCP